MKNVNFFIVKVLVNKEWPACESRPFRFYAYLCKFYRFRHRCATVQIIICYIHIIYETGGYWIFYQKS